jgi:ABC-type long-subunit fatty acid transport system fused permease/ATPase subunit
MSPASKPRVEGGELARALWRLVRIYWTSPDAKWGALLLAAAIALQLGGVYANVLVSVAQRDVGNALGDRDAAAFGRGIGLLIAFMLISVVVPAYADWVQQRLRVRWRRGLTAHYLERWIGPQAYCQADLHRQQLDNPDVRIAEDVRDFVASACGLSLSLLSAVVTLVSFAAMLWNISAAWAIPIAGKTREIPGLLLWVALAFALFSMWITNAVGRRLVPLNFDKIRLEADFRYGLVRYRDHVEAVALSRGEAVERIGAVGRFLHVYDNFCQLVGAQRNLSILTQGIGVANTLVPLVAAGLAYFAGVLTLGVIPQTRFAYGQVAGALAWFVNAYQEIARWRANIERLTAFSEVIDATEREFERGGIRIERAEANAIRLEGLRVEAPRGRVLLDGANATVAAGERVAIAGRDLAVRRRAHRGAAARAHVLPVPATLLADRDAARRGLLSVGARFLSGRADPGGAATLRARRARGAPRRGAAVGPEALGARAAAAGAGARAAPGARVDPARRGHLGPRRRHRGEGLRAPGPAPATCGRDRGGRAARRAPLPDAALAPRRERTGSRRTRCGLRGRAGDRRGHPSRWLTARLTSWQAR